MSLYGDLLELLIPAFSGKATLPDGEACHSTQEDDDFFPESFEVHLGNLFLLIKGKLFWLGVTCYFLSTWGQRLPGAAGVVTPDPQIPSLLPKQSVMATP